MTQELSNEAIDCPITLEGVAESLANVPGLEIEICGTWLWIGGDTKTAKETLKAHRCRWSRNKGKWYWKKPGSRRSFGRGRYNMQEIRELHGSAVLKNA